MLPQATPTDGRFVNTFDRNSPVAWAGGGSCLLVIHSRLELLGYSEERPGLGRPMDDPADARFCF